MGSSGINMNPMIALSSLLALASANPLKFPGQGGLSLTQRVPNPCSTLQGTACVFPFTYDGVEYYQCTYKNSPTPWGATKLDPNGTVIVNNWGDCANTQTSACPVEDLTKPTCTAVSGSACVSTTSVQMLPTLRSLTPRPGAPLRSHLEVNTLMVRPLSAPTPVRELPPILLLPPPPQLQQQLQQLLLHQPPQPQQPPQQPQPPPPQLPPPPLLPL